MTTAFLFIGIAVWIATVRWPLYGIFLPLVVHPLYLVRGSIGPFPTTLLEVVTLAVIIGAGTWIIRERNTVMSTLKLSSLWVVGIGSGVFLLSATIAAVIASHQATAWGIWKAMVIEPMVYVAILGIFVIRYALMNRFIFALLLGGTGSALMSLIAGFPLHNFTRLSGIYDVPNSLALVMAPLLVLAVGMYVQDRKPIVLAISFLFGVIVILTQSLGGMVAAIIGIAVVVIKHPAWRKRGLVAVLVFMILATAFQGVTGRLAFMIDKEDSSIIARLQLWQASVYLLQQNPIMGIGLGNYEPAYQDALRDILNKCPDEVPCLIPKPSVPTPPLEWVARDPHNILLSFWLNTGIFGLLGMGILLGNIFRMSVFRDVFAPALFTIIAFGFVDVPYWKNDLAILWWALILGIIVAKSRGAVVQE